MIEICHICNCTAHGMKNQKLSFYLIKNMKPKRRRKLWLASVDKPRECRSLCHIKDTSVLSTARVYNSSCIQPQHSVRLASRYHSINYDIRYNLWRYACNQRVNCLRFWYRWPFRSPSRSGDDACAVEMANYLIVWAWQKEDDDFVKKCMKYVEGSRPKGRPKRTWTEVVQKGQPSMQTEQGGCYESW